MKTTSVFSALLESGASTGKDNMRGFEPFYRQCPDGLIRIAGWEKTVFQKIDSDPFRLMDIRVERDIGRYGLYRCVVDFTTAVQEIGSKLAEPQDIVGVFPVRNLLYAEGLRVEGPWKTDANDVFDEIDPTVSKIVRMVLDAIDKRHDRMMPVFDIWKAIPRRTVMKNPSKDDGNAEQTLPRVEKLADRVKGDSFRDAVHRWSLGNGGRGIGTSMEGVFLDGCRCFPSKEEAELWNMQASAQEGPMFLVKEGADK